MIIEKQVVQGTIWGIMDLHRAQRLSIAERPEESVRGVYQLDVRKGASGMFRKRIMFKGLSGKLKVGRHHWNVKVGREAKGKQESTEL